jgi:hypothetical protein
MSSALGDRAERERREDQRCPEHQRARQNTRALKNRPIPDRDDPRSRKRHRAKTQQKTEALARETKRLKPNSGARQTQHNTEGLSRGDRTPTQPTPEALARGSGLPQPNTEEPARKQNLLPQPITEEPSPVTQKKTRFASLSATAKELQAVSDDEETPDEPPKEKTKVERVAEKRNRARVERADATDQKLLSKYLPTNIDDFLPSAIPGPDDSFTPPAWLMEAIEEVMNSTAPIPKAPPVKFDLSEESIQHNTELLKGCELDMQELLVKHQDTTLGFGSEFRPIEQMEKILGRHPNFSFFSEVLTNGMDYHFTEELSEEQRKAEVRAMITRGNHQSVKEDWQEVAKLLEKDVLHGFSLPVHPDVVPDITRAMVQPAGVVKQFSLREDGSRTLKRRLTQDLSFPLTFWGASVNNRIDMDAYTEMIYGWCLTRIIHFIVALRLAYPLLPIFIVKYDYSDAYRRIAHSPMAAAQSIIVFAGIAYIALRLTFGGSPNPPTWCAFSEMVTDLSNEIALCKEWDHTTLRSPAQPKTPTPIVFPDDIPFAPAMPMAVHVPTTVTARTDSFIDDLIRVFLDTPENREREPHAVPLAIHVTSRPHMGPAEPVKRRGLLSAPKLEAEGTPAEEQIVLGWLLDTRRLLILLPFDKYEAWSSDLQTILLDKRVTYGELESTLGRLNHVGYIIPLARHFLNKLRLRIRQRRHKHQHISLNSEELEDLDLWCFFLSAARTGISLNRVTTRKPSKICWSDSCPYGIGGFLLSGRAWRIRIPPSSPIYGVDIANNVLEFLGMMVTVWLVILECKEQNSTQDCILALGDNTSAIGWLYKSSRLIPGSPYYEPVQLIARKLARLITGSTHCLASQHIKGENNVVSDLLSYAGDVRGDAHPLAPDSPSDTVLTARFHLHLPQLIPTGFDISPLPNEISSFVILALQTIESSLIRSRKKPTKNETASGADGSRSASKPASNLTLSSLEYPTEKLNSSSEPFSPSIEWLRGARQEPFLANVRAPWFRQLCAMPQAIWLRRSGVTSNGAPFTSREAPSYFPPSQPS